MRVNVTSRAVACRLAPAVCALTLVPLRLSSIHGVFHERLGLMGGLGRMAAGGRQTCHGTVQ